MEAYHQLDKEGKLKLRMHGGYQVFADKNPIADIEHAVELREKYKGSRFDIDTIKILLDGVLESRTAYLTEPYSNKDDGYHGMLRFDTDALADIVKKTNEDMQLVQPADFDRMAKLGVIAVANPFWFIKEPLYHEKLSVPYLGAQRAEKQYPMKAFFDKNIVVTQIWLYLIRTLRLAIPKKLPKQKFSAQ